MRSRLGLFLRRTLGSTRALALVGVVCLTILLAVTASASNGLPTRGTIPEAAIKSNGIDLSLVPDYVPALDRDGNVAGWISKYDLEPPAEVGPRGILPEQPSPVYADDLTTVVGHMVPNKGFVRVGVNADKVPDFPASVAPES